MPDKPQLHVSMMGMMTRCGEQFRRRYGARFGIADREEIIPPNIALTVGISTHQSVEHSLTTKMTTGQLPSLEEVRDHARDFAVANTCKEMLLTAEEAENKDKSLSQAVDQVVALSSLHRSQIAPHINPAAGGIEEKFVIDLPNYPIDISGQIDCREDIINVDDIMAPKKEEIVRDTKTARAKPADGAAMSMQMAMYAISRQVKTGQLPIQVAVDYLVKTKTPKAITITAKPEPIWLDPLLHRVKRSIEIIETSKKTMILNPANPDHWCCHPKWCGYYATCKFAGGK